MEEWLAAAWDTLPGKAVALTGALAALDGIIGNFRTARAVGRGVAVVARYLLDFVMAPINVRRLQESERKRNVLEVEPVRHLGAIWLPSDVVEGECVAYCMYCWAEKVPARITLVVQGLDSPNEGASVQVFCRRDATHGRDHFNQCMSASRDEWLHAVRHAYDRRRAQGL